MFEEIYTLHKKKWIDKETWDQRAAFLERYCQQPMFRRVYDISRGTFDPDFEEYVNGLMKKEG
ncbi:MAG: hypothetical protein JRN09_03455 [Nitrososphaerota archaeon]|jgi:hypothetical protein|nr:hypothetical protein [Nitrososphaerota archaeon]